MNWKAYEEMLTDRNNAFDDVKPNFSKKIYLDLYLKEIILFVNSIGRKNYKTFRGDYFVNEIKNSNMSNNLANSRCASLRCGNKTLTLEFYQIKHTGHLRIGYLKPLLLIVVTTLLYAVSLFLEAICKSKNKLAFIMLATTFRVYLKCFDFKEQRIFLMTDHHFFSSIIALTNTQNTYILQHGLILDKRFYYPIRAGHFCAWGNHSMELVNNDPKAMVTGTMKFADMYSRPNRKIQKIIYCISSLDNTAVEEKINITSNVAKQFGFEFMVKCHPGSMFSLDYWASKFQDVVFYKEEKIADIDFDLAISENSTINVDFAVMNIPFIIYDDDIGYFERYKDILAICNSKKQLIDVIRNLDKYDFDEINKTIIDNELNGNHCSLFVEECNEKQYQ